MDAQDIGHRLMRRARPIGRQITQFASQLGVARLAVGAVVLVAGSVLIYKTYESRVTAGVGFVEATDIDIPEGVDVRTKKTIFFDTMRPIVKAENQRLGELREDLLQARERGQTDGWVEDVAEDMGVDWTGKEWTTLLKRVDTIPLTLVLAQSANESSWGQSRFAREGNNMFGQWCFSEGCGMVPKGRESGKNHEVASYSTVNDSVRSYMRNINTQPAYKELREIRWQMRQANQQPTAMRLVQGLTRYSERGDAYLEEIRAMIRVNRDLMIGDTA